MKKITFFLALLCVITAACTKEKTNYTGEIDSPSPEIGDFKELITINRNGYSLKIETQNGTLYKGYNELRVYILDAKTQKPAQVSELAIVPLKTSADNTVEALPHQIISGSTNEQNYYTGYAIFSAESSQAEKWGLDINFNLSGLAEHTLQPVSIQPQTNKNLGITMFTASDKQQYLIALISPAKPQAGSNELVAGIYKRIDLSESPTNAVTSGPAFQYVPLSNHLLKLDPRMPEPSMGNHTSPNNKDLSQGKDGLYHGTVNYTMTGGWTLNFILLAPDGQIKKGTIVPPDFTPGVEGEKSELFIDIQF